MEQLPGALQTALGQLQIGPCLGQLGAAHRIVEADQQDAGRDPLAFLEMQGGDAPVDLRAQQHRLVGQQRAEGQQLVAHQTALRLHHLDQGGGLLRGQPAG
ncbi:hypothetical protein D3C81_1903600 [compost metagenome]